MNNGYSSAPSKAFIKLMRSIGFAAGAGKNFHSFRHTLSTRLDRFNISELAIGRITGHVNAACMTGKRYIKTAVLQERVEIVNTLDFRDLLGHVKPYNQLAIVPVRPSSRTRKNRIISDESSVRHSTVFGNS
jgi:hypothetical protein